MIQSGNYFILWSNNSTSTAIEEQFAPEHIICSADKLKTAKLGSADGIIVLCELNWDENGIEREPSIFYGVDLVKHHLRVSKRLRVPILFVSFMPESFFESNPHYMILNAVGHSFKQLEPSLFGNWDKVFFENGLKPLNEIQFSDIVTNLCDLRGLIGEITHNAGSKIRGVIESNPLDTNKIFEEISQILDEHLNEICHLLDNRPDVLLVKKELICSFNEEVKRFGVLEAAKEFISKYDEQLKALAHDTDAPSAPSPHDWGWKALILDDDLNGVKKIIQMLKRSSKSHYVISTKTS